MATQQDLAVLRQLVQQGRLAREDAARCLDLIERRAGEGRPLDALAAGRELGLFAGGVAPAPAFVPLEGALSEFLIGPQLGVEPLGSLHDGRRRADQVPVLVRVLPATLLQRPALAEEVKGELQRWVGVTHPRLSATLAAGEARGRLVVVTARTAGEALSVHLERRGGPLPGPAVEAALRDVAEALAALHGRDLAHGDVRAERVWSDGRRAWLTGLGLSRAHALAAGQARFGVPFGHSDALAPEVLQEGLHAPTPASDIYALGVLAYRLSCGVLPFRGEVPAVLEQHFDATPPPPPAGVKLRRSLARMILRMLAKSPEARPGAAEVVAALDYASRNKTSMAVPTLDWSLASAEHAESGAGWSADRLLAAPEPVPAEEEPDPLEASARGQLAAPKLAPDGELQLGKQLGRGPVGACYEAQLRGAPVVVKLVSRKFANKPELQERVLEAMRAATRLQAPGVVRALELRPVEGREAMVCERAAGRTLREELDERRRLEPLAAVTLARDLARALAAAEKAGVHHGDLRPEKVYVAAGAPARLADFGLAEASCKGAGFGRFGLRFGHPGYLAPEVLQEKRRGPDARSDAYALGILLWEALAGRLPFPAEPVQEALVAHLRAPLPEPPADVLLAPPLARLLLRLTAKDPRKRPASAAVLAEELERCREELEQASGDELEVPAELMDEQGWSQESEQVSRPAGSWDRGKISRTVATASLDKSVEEWSPDEEASGAGQLYRELSHSELGSSREEILQELGIDGSVAAQAWLEEQARRTTCRECGTKLSGDDLRVGEGVCAECRVAGVVLRQEAEAEREAKDADQRNRVLLREEEAWKRPLRTTLYALLFWTGIAGLVWTFFSRDLPTAVGVGAVVAALGAGLVHFSARL